MVIPRSGRFRSLSGPVTIIIIIIIIIDEVGSINPDIIHIRIRTCSAV